jgi:hypothetical protein
MKSPFEQYLDKNYVPSDSEVKQIQRHLVPRTLEVSRIEKLIKDLSSQRDEAIAYIDAHKALISLARRLPHDIVQEIFLACLPMHRNAVMSAREAPLVLTRICSAWRAVAMATPALWASLHLPLEYVFEHSLLTPVTHWLDCSGRCPLSLSLVGPSDLEHWEDCDADRVGQVMNQLIRSSDRWTRVELSFYIGQGLLRLSAVEAPHLVAIKTKAEPSELQQMKLLSTPSLREVTLCLAREFDTYVPPMPFRWDQLTHISLENSTADHWEGLSPHIAIQILQRCPRLIHCTLPIRSDLVSRFPDIAPETHVSLPQLRTFILSYHPSFLGLQSLSYLLEHLSMPLLRRLQLPRTAQTFVLTASFLGALSSRSPSIDELDIDLTGLTQESLFDGLRGLHHLRKLVVFDNDGRQYPGAPVIATAQALLAFLAAPTICPLLQELQIIEGCSLPNGDEDIMSLARARLDGGGGHFTRLVVDYKFITSVIEPDSEVLAAFAAHGLAISTSSPTFTQYLPVPDTPWTGL